MAANTFSSSGEDAIQRTVALDPYQTRLDSDISATAFAEYYDIERTVQEISVGDYKRIALQFPDELLHDSVPIYQRLKHRLGDGRELYVLADTSYGRQAFCCVDEVAAQHVDADVVIHYGHACMSKTYRLPVIYVFGKKPLDVATFAEKMGELLRSSKLQSNSVLLQHDVALTHLGESAANALRDALRSDQIDVHYSPVPQKLNPTSSAAPQVPEAPSTPEAYSSHTNAQAALDACPILYVGPPSLGFTNLLMTHSTVPVYGYDPTTQDARIESIRTNKMLMRRYAVVQKARDADVFGILVGTLGIASYLPLISHLRRILGHAHKKSYTISVGKLNPSKLANFMEIECFVLVACPENSLIEAKDFFRPIVTPYELEIALRPEPIWTGEYILDFEKLLARTSFTDSVDAEERDLDEPTFSLVTGQYRHSRRYGGLSADDASNPESLQGPNSSAVVPRNHDSTVATLRNSAAGEYLQTRTFQGLETRAGLDAPSILEQGRSGIARGYGDDHQSS
ncbi:diphthamide biosynthesis protein [Artomyces pyxidatus]|uniref:Diphthamide biosynthesis protein n=1 Tax=Artomyces pyxidatus TaxID=48021 RepID=A0ACB8T8G0_9AGAM|nr:diphthamide biosynthesis protein [Artomyces pyxidatus]